MPIKEELEKLTLNQEIDKTTLMLRFYPYKDYYTTKAFTKSLFLAKEKLLSNMTFKSNTGGIIKRIT